MSKATLIPAIATGIVAAAVVALVLRSAPAPATLEGLAAPRGLTAVDGKLLVAEGGAGRLLLWDLSGEPDVISDGFPYLENSGIEGESASGISAAVPFENGYLAVVGEARNKGHQELYRLTPGTPPVGVTGQDVLATTHPQPITNPYDLVVEPNGDAIVTDSGRNTLLRITPGGDVSGIATFDPIVVDGEELDAVPTGIARASDGALYVATLSGWPHPAGAARVYRYDGAILAVAQEGFTAATDVAFEPDGSLLVTEFSTSMQELLSNLTLKRAAEFSGRLVRRTAGGEIEVIADDLVGPTAVAVVDGRIFVSEEFAGRVREVGGTPPPKISLTAWLLAALAGIIAAAVIAFLSSRLRNPPPQGED